MKSKLLPFFALFISQQVSATNTGFSFTSSPTSWVGKGDAYMISDSTPDYSISFTSSGGLLNMRIASDNSPGAPEWEPNNGKSYNYWTIQIAAPSGNDLAVGNYAGAARYPFQGAALPGLNFDGNHRGNNQLSGFFNISEIGFDAQGNINQFAASFTQYDEKNQAAWGTGQIRLNSTIPLADPTLFWNGASSSAWNTGSNWTSSQVPSITKNVSIAGPANDVGSLSINFNAANALNSLTITNTNTTSILNSSGSSKAMTIASGGITTGAGAVQIGSVTSNQEVPIMFAADQTWNVGSGGLTVSNFVAGQGTSSDGSGRSLTKIGEGNLTFDSRVTNGFAGSLTVNSGTVTLRYANMTTPTNLLNSGYSVFLGGGTLTMTGKNVATNSSQTFARTTLEAGRNAINLTKGAAATSATLNLGTLTVKPGSVTMISPATVWAAGSKPTAEIVRVSSISGSTLPTTGLANANAGLFHRVASNTSTSGARWVSVDSSGQFQTAASVPDQGVSGTTTTANQVRSGGSNVTLTGNAQSYGLYFNANTSTARTLNLDTFGYTINGITGIGSGSGTIAATSGRLLIGSERNFVINNDNTGTITINAPIDNNGSVAGVGGSASSVLVTSTIASGTPGVVTFSRANTYTGNTTINAGTLLLTSTGSIHASSAVTVAQGGTLAGSGTVNGPLTLSGRLSPGVNNIATLNAGPTSVNGGSVFQFNLAQTGNSSDKLDVSGVLSKGTAGTFQFDFMGSQPSSNVFTLASFDSSTGFLASDFSFTNLAGSNNTGFFTLHSTSLTFTAVPEASNLVIGGLVALGLFQRRRKPSF